MENTKKITASERIKLTPYAHALGFGADGIDFLNDGLKRKAELQGKLKERPSKELKKKE